MPQSISTLRSYRAYLVPQGVEPHDVERHAAAGLLRTERIKATDCDDAAGKAFKTFNLPVYKTERVEPTEPAGTEEQDDAALEAA